MYRLIFPDINGAPRGKLIAPEHFAVTKHYGIPSLVMVDDIEGKEAPGATSNWIPSEDSDILMVPDESTLIPVPHNAEVEAQVIVDLTTSGGRPIPVAPRNVLKQVLEGYHERGFEIKIANELEFYVLTPEGQIPEQAAKHEKPYADINALDNHYKIVGEIFDMTRTLGLQPEGVTKEDNEGQYEVTFGPTEALFMADRTLYFKQLVKEVLRRNDLSGTFMAQPFGDAPGSGGHIHLSLWKDGKNLFDTEPELLEQFVSGNLRFMRALSALFAPNPNSFRRWNIWGRGAKQPSYSHESRKEAAIRITKHGDHGTHLEHRLSGADVSPHLAFAGILAAGLYGIEHKLSYQSKEVTEQMRLNLPLTTQEALALFNDDAIKQLLGKDFVELFTAVKSNELASFNRAVTDWERNAYGPQV
jgi:glutamine synthetase